MDELNRLFAIGERDMERRRSRNGSESDLPCVYLRLERPTILSFFYCHMGGRKVCARVGFKKKRKRVDRVALDNLISQKKCQSMASVQCVVHKCPPSPFSDRRATLVPSH